MCFVRFVVLVVLWFLSLVLLQINFLTMMLASLGGSVLLYGFGSSSVRWGPKGSPHLTLPLFFLVFSYFVFPFFCFWKV